MRVHVQVVAADVSLRAPVRDGSEAKRGVMLLWFLELSGETGSGKEEAAGRQKKGTIEEVLVRIVMWEREERSRTRGGVRRKWGRGVLGNRRKKGRTVKR